MSTGKVSVKYTTPAGNIIEKDIEFLPPVRKHHEPADKFILRIDRAAYRALAYEVKINLLAPFTWSTDLGYRNF